MRSIFSRLAQAIVLMTLVTFLTTASAAAPRKQPSVEIFVFPGVQTANMPRIGLDKILDDVEFVSMNGDQTQWRNVFRGTWSNSSEQLLARIDGAISANTRWSPVRAEAGERSTSVWIFQGQDRPGLEGNAGNRARLLESWQGVGHGDRSKDSAGLASGADDFPGTSMPSLPYLRARGLHKCAELRLLARSPFFL